MNDIIELDGLICERITAYTNVITKTIPSFSNIELLKDKLTRVEELEWMLSIVRAIEKKER